MGGFTKKAYIYCFLILYILGESALLKYNSWLKRVVEQKGGPRQEKKRRGIVPWLGPGKGGPFGFEGLYLHSINRIISNLTSAQTRNNTGGDGRGGKCAEKGKKERLGGGQTIK